MMEEALEVLPDPERMIEGLRDTGYEFNTAIADLIDNSIAANATKIDVRINLDYRGTCRLSISDNGVGMDKNGLINGMKYGSKKRAHPSSLGKFGLGLKTASTAFARRLMVTTRQGAGEALRACWDLDHVAEKMKWELIIDSPDKQTLDHLNSIAGDGSGTVVVWEKIDRLLKNYATPGGVSAKKGLQRKIDDLKEHVAMIYQRFLDRKNGQVSNLSIVVDGEEIKPWDPFCVGKSDLVASKDLEVEGTSSTFKINAYVLPRREEFASQDEASRAKIGNDYQGFYIYRENRLIHYADWLGMFSKEPHGSLLRVEFSFDHKLDEAFHIDIKKSKIILDQGLYDLLKDQFLPAPRRAANERYRQGQRKLAHEKAGGAHAESNTSIGSKLLGLGSADVTAIPGRDGEALIKNAKGEIRIKLKSTKSLREGEVFIQPVPSIDEGILFEPALIDGEKGVRINTSHPYYHKVYIPNLKSGVTIQGMDSLLWALCTAEYSTVDQSTSEHFEELRYELSRILRKLVSDLPEPDLNGNETE